MAETEGGAVQQMMEALRHHLPITLLADLVPPAGPPSEEIAARERAACQGDLSSGHALGPPA